MTTATPGRRARKGGVPEATVARLPVYHRALTALAERGVATVSSEELAVAAGVNSAKLRKDLSHLGSYGTRGVGYDVDDLIVHIGRELGLTQDWSVVIVGRRQPRAGARQLRRLRLARASASSVSSTPTPPGSARPSPASSIRPLSDLERVVADEGVNIGVIATPAGAAQDVCDRLVGAGVTSILNFAPTVLAVSDEVDLRKVDLATELQILAFHEQRKSDLVAVAPVSILVVGLSHRSAPVRLLERAAVVSDEVPALLARVTDAPHVGEAVVLSTCNRVELYAVVDKFHGGVEDLTGLLADHAGTELDELTPSPLRPLRRARRAAPVLRGLRPRLDGRR